MFKPAVLRIFAILAMVLCALGLLTSLVVGGWAGIISLAAVSWALLLWASYIAFQLTSYKLYEDEYKKLGFRIYLIIGAFLIFMMAGFTIGLVFVVVLLGALWGMKRNYDEWPSTPSAPEEPKSDPE